jgi:hypothetical protein
MIRATLKSLDYIVKHESESVAYMQKTFGLDARVASGSYKIIQQVLNVDGDVEEAVLRSVVESMKKDAQITADVALDRVADLSVLREVRAEAANKR